MRDRLRRAIITTIAVVACVASVQAQTPEIDSLKSALASTSDPKQKVDILYELSLKFWYHDLKESRKFAEAAIDIAEKTNDPEQLTKSFTAQGSYFYFTGEYALPSRAFYKALASTKGKNFGEFPAYTFARLGTLYRAQGYYDSASYYYQKAFLLYDSRKPLHSLSTLYLNKGIAFFELSVFDSASWCIQKSYNIRKRVGDSVSIGEIWRFKAAMHLAQANYDSATFYLQKLHTVASRNLDSELMLFYNLYKGSILKEKGQYASALYEYEAALEALERFDSKRYQSIVLRSIGEIYSNLGNYTKALDYLLRSLRIDEQLNSRHEVARSNSSIGWMYVNQHNYEQAMVYAKKSLSQMKQVNDVVGISYVHNLLGMIALRQKFYSHALLYFDSAYVVRKNFNLEIFLASTLQNKALVYKENGDLANALRMQMEALEVFNRLQNENRIAVTCNHIGQLMLATGNTKRAEDYYLKALDANRKTGSGLGKQQTYLNLAHLYTITKNYKKATENYDQYIGITDSLAEAQNVQKIAEISALYQLEKKENKIELLNKENQANQDKISLQESELARQNNLILFSVVGILLVISFLILALKYSRDKTRANERLQILNGEIQEQKEEIQAQSEELAEANQAIGNINKDLEIKVQERTHELRQAYLELDTFFYRSSHDFRRPLTTFMGLAEVGKITVKDPNAIELFDKVKETAVGLDNMIRKLQSISDVGTHETMYREILLSEMIENILLPLRAALSHKAIEVTQEYKLTQPFFSYPVLVKAIIENLIENSIHFCSLTSPVIRISISTSFEGIKGVIEDNGQGISPEHMLRIFDMYYRANLGSSGNGLGLYVAKKAVAKLGGTIHAESELLKGSVFSFYLPSGVQRS
jgi:signal transduction histidine kinase